MKQIGIRLEEELIQKAKIFALQHSLTLQDLVSNALSSYIDNKITTKQPTTETPKPIHVPPTLTEPPKPAPKPKIEPKPGQLVGTLLEDPLTEVIYDPDVHFILRKTHKKVQMKENSLIYRKYGLHWMVLVDDYVHYDKDGEVIPFRFTSGYAGTTYEPSSDEIRELEKATGKKVLFE